MMLQMGNLTVKQFATRVEADFTDMELELLESHRTDIADFSDQTKFHIFDDPAISINIGAEALKMLAPVFKEANARRTFNREVPFYPTRTNPVRSDDYMEI